MRVFLCSYIRWFRRHSSYIAYNVSNYSYPRCVIIVRYCQCLIVFHDSCVGKCVIVAQLILAAQVVAKLRFLQVSWPSAAMISLLFLLAGVMPALAWGHNVSVGFLLFAHRDGLFN